MAFWAASFAGRTAPHVALNYGVAVRVLACSQPGHGHLRPIEPLIVALKNNDHEVTIASSQKFAAAAAKLGCALTPVGIDWVESELDEVFPGARKATANSNVQSSVERAVFAGATAQAALPDLLRYVEQQKPELIVRSGWEFASWAVAQQTGTPLVTVNPTLFGPKAFNRTFGKPLARLAGRRGLVPYRAHAAVHRFPSILTTPESSVLPDEVVPQNTRWFAAPSAKTRTLGRSRRANSAPPRIHVSLGTVVHRPDLYQSVLDALRPIECEVIIAAPASITDQLATTGNVSCHSFVDHAALLPTCDLFIHHGGTGSVLASLDHQIPVVVLPGWADQPRNARACEQMGIGRAVATNHQDASMIRTAVVAVLDSLPVHHDRFREIAGEMADRPSLAVALPWVLSFKQ